MKKCILSFLILISLSPFVNAQTHFPRVAAGDPGLVLVTPPYQIDTSNIAELRNIADSISHPKNGLALLYLALHGYSDITTQLKNGVVYSLQTKNSFPGDYLGGLYLLGNSETHSLTIMSIDTMMTQEQGGIAQYRTDDWVDAIDLLLAYGDFTRYQFFLSLFNRADKPDESALGVLAGFGLNSSLRYDVYNQLKNFAQSNLFTLSADTVSIGLINNLSPERKQELISLMLHQRNVFRVYAVSMLAKFTDMTDLSQFCRQIALGDSDATVRFAAIDILANDLHSSAALEALAQLATTTTNSTIFEEAILETKYYPSLSSLVTLENIQNTISSAAFKNYVSVEVANFTSPPFPDDWSISRMLDTLNSYKNQAIVLNWLGDVNFSNTLSGYVSNAKTAILRFDSVSACQQLTLFEQAVDREVR